MIHYANPCNREDCAEVRDELLELRNLLNTPELDDFVKGAVLEAEHQRLRHGDKVDLDKKPEEWFWLVGYLAGKGLQAQRQGDMNKFRHHLISTAAVLANWHVRVMEKRK